MALKSRQLPPVSLTPEEQPAYGRPGEVTVRFISRWQGYNKDVCAGFPADFAKKLVEKRIAVRISPDGARRQFYNGYVKK